MMKMKTVMEDVQREVLQLKKKNTDRDNKKRKAERRGGEREIMGKRRDCKAHKGKLKGKNET